MQHSLSTINAVFPYSMFFFFSIMLLEILSQATWLYFLMVSGCPLLVPMGAYS